jgi:uncharacterized protein
VAFLTQHLTEIERERTTVVFDAAEAPPGLPREFIAGGIAIRFAAAGKDADDTIEELIAGHSAPRQIRLVSSDHRLQRSAQKRRGTFLDSEDFVQELERRGPLQEENDGPQPVADSAGKRVTDTETERWLRVFGEMPEAKALARESRGGDSMTQADVARIKKEVDRLDVEPRKRGKSAKRGL